jgi:5-(carboxyamino)imidazole ribonucleotide synthase
VGRAAAGAERSIGVVGGGQLAWMLAAAARDLGLELHVQTPSSADPAAALATSVLEAPLHNVAATRELARRCGAISFENEWLDLEALAPLEAGGIRFVPHLRALAPLVCKKAQRQLLQHLNLPSLRWCDLPATGALPAELGFPVVAKASRGAYDGMGTEVLHAPAELASLARRVEPGDWILEEFVAFELELAQLVCRDSSGQVQCYPLVQTHQHQQVCDWVLAPAAVPQAVQAFARNIACSLVTALDYVGVLSIEFFYGPAGLQINEIAPRTHNSGHVTIEACATSQFSQQVRIVAGLPLGPVDLQVGAALMVNLLGFETSDADYSAQRLALAALPGATVHWYGKRGSRPGRKLGHITLVLDSGDAAARQQQADQRLAEVRAIWPLPGAPA